MVAQKNDYIRAGSGNEDIVIGGAGDDHLRGEDGNDILDWWPWR
ncbi:hypothetical protein O9992_19635 [Vibrio lentus]|nr:hypothetical protein [Vibrio lentus]